MASKGLCKSRVTAMEKLCPRACNVCPDQTRIAATEKSVTSGNEHSIKHLPTCSSRNE